MTNRYQVQEQKDEITHTPEESLKSVLQATCGVSIDALSFTGDKNDLVKIHFSDEKQRSRFREQFVEIFNFPQRFDAEISNYVKNEAPLTPYMYDPALSQYARRYSEAPTVKGALRFLKRLIPARDYLLLSELEEHLKEAEEKTGTLTSSWVDEKEQQQQNRKTGLETAIATVGNYLSFVSLQRIQNCLQTGCPLPLRKAPHIISTAPSSQAPTIKSQTPFLTNRELHERIFKIEHNEKGQYRLVLDIQRLYDLIAPLRLVLKERYDLFSRRAFARRFGHLLEPHGSVLVVDGKPIFAEDFRESETTVMQKKRGRVHLVLDYSGSMNDHAENLTSQIKTLCANQLEQGNGVDITYFYKDCIYQLSLDVKEKRVQIETNFFSYDGKKYFVYLDDKGKEQSYPHIEQSDLDLKDLFLPTKGYGKTPLNMATTLALQKTKPEDQLIIFTDGEPLDNPVTFLNQAPPPECYLYGCGSAERSWFDKVKRQWSDQAEKYGKTISCKYDLFSGSVNINDFIQNAERCITSFTKTGDHTVKLNGVEFSVPEGAGPIQSRTPITVIDQKNDASYPQKVQQPSFCNPKHFYAAQETSCSIGGGDTHVPRQLGGFFSDTREDRCKMWLKKNWEKMVKNEKSFLENTKQLLEDYSKESFWFLRASFNEDIFQKTTAKELMTALMKAPASSKSHPIYIVQVFLREQYFKSPSFNGDLPYPTLDAKTEERAEPASESTPLLSGQSDEKAADASPAVLLATSTVLINYLITHRHEKIQAAYGMLINDQKSENSDEQSQHRENSSQRLTTTQIQKLVKTFIIDLGFFAYLSVCLAGYRNAYQQAETIVNEAGSATQIIERLSPLLCTVGRSSYLYQVIMLLREKGLTQEQKSSCLTEANFDSRGDLGLKPVSAACCIQPHR